MIALVCFMLLKLRIPYLFSGEVVNNIIAENRPKEVLIVGCHVGFVLLQVLRSSPSNVRIFVVENNFEFIEFAKYLLKTVGKPEESKVLYHFIA